MPQFGNALFPTTRQMLDFLAGEYLTAGGSNGADFIAAELTTHADAALAADAIRDFALDQAPDPSDAASVSHMAREGYAAEDLAQAFGRLRAAGQASDQ